MSSIRLSDVAFTVVDIHSVEHVSKTTATTTATATATATAATATTTTIIQSGEAPF